MIRSTSLAPASPPKSCAQTQRTRCATPWRAAFRRATLNASIETSTAVTCQSGDSRATLTARHPDPVPRCEDVGRDLELVSPELPIACDEGDRLSPLAARDHPLVASQKTSRCRHASLGQIGCPVPSQCVSSQDLGVDASLVRFEACADQARPSFSHESTNRRHVSTSSADLSFSD